MKYLLIVGAVVTLLSATTLPASAFVCTQETTHGSATAVPPICALPETRQQHPGWYRDGGYCEGATNVSEVTGSTHCKYLGGF